MLAVAKPATLIALALTVGASAALAQDPLPQADRPVIAILDFTNSALVNHDLYEPFTVGMSAMLISELRRNPGIELVERERLRQVLEEIQLGRTGQVDQSTAVRAGKILNAHHIIFGVFVIDLRGNLRLDARAVSVETSGIEHVETVSDDADDLLRAVRKLGQQLSAGLNLPAASHRPPDAGEAKDGQVMVNLKYARALMEEDRRNPDRAVQLYREFLAESPADYAVIMREEAEQRIRILNGSQRDDATPRQGNL